MLLAELVEVSAEVGGDARSPEEDRRAGERSRAPGAGRGPNHRRVPLGRAAAPADRHRLGGAPRSPARAGPAARAQRARRGRLAPQDRSDDGAGLAGGAAGRAGRPLLPGNGAGAAVPRAPPDRGAPPGSATSSDGRRDREGGRSSGHRGPKGGDAGGRPWSGCRRGADVRQRRARNVPADALAADPADARAAGDGHRVRARTVRRGRRGVEARRGPAPGSRPGRRGPRLYAEPRRRDGPRAGGGGGAAWALARGRDSRRRGDRARRAGSAAPVPGDDEPVRQPARGGRVARQRSALAVLLRPAARGRRGRARPSCPRADRGARRTVPRGAARAAHRDRRRRGSGAVPRRRARAAATRA